MSSTISSVQIFCHKLFPLPNSQKHCLVHFLQQTFKSQIILLKQYFSKYLKVFSILWSLPLATGYWAPSKFAIKHFCWIFQNICRKLFCPDEWYVSRYFLYYPHAPWPAGWIYTDIGLRYCWRISAKKKYFTKTKKLHLGFLPILAHMMRSTPAPINENSMRKG